LTGALDVCRLLSGLKVTKGLLFEDRRISAWCVFFTVMKLRLAGATAFFIASLLNPEASGKNGSRPNPTPTPTQSGPSAPALVAPANAASVVQPMTLDWNPVSVSGGPIGSYTWQVGTSSTFGTTGAASYTSKSATRHRSRL
jgi:hypothetical protein